MTIIFNCPICYEDKTKKYISLCKNHSWCFDCYKNLVIYKYKKCPFCRKKYRHPIKWTITGYGKEEWELKPCIIN